MSMYASVAESARTFPSLFDGYRVSILTRMPNPSTVKLIKKYGGNVVINPHITDANGTLSIALADSSLLHRIPPQLLVAFGNRVYSPAAISDCVRQHSIQTLQQFRIYANKPDNDVDNRIASSPPPAPASTPFPASSTMNTNSHSHSLLPSPAGNSPSTKLTSPLAATSQPPQTTVVQRKRKQGEDAGGSPSPIDPNTSSEDCQNSSSRLNEIEAAIKYLEASGFSRVMIVHALLVTSGDMKLARAYLSNQLPQDVYLWGPQEDLALNGHDAAVTKQLVQRIGKLETAKRVKFLHSA